MNKSKSKSYTARIVPGPLSQSYTYDRKLPLSQEEWKLLTPTQRLEISQQSATRIANLINQRANSGQFVPLSSEHMKTPSSSPSIKKPFPLGKITRAWCQDMESDHGGVFVDFEFDSDLPGSSAAENIMTTGYMPELSLSHDANTDEPLEVSLVFVGARPGTAWWSNAVTSLPDSGGGEPRFRLNTNMDSYNTKHFNNNQNPIGSIIVEASGSSSTNTSTNTNRMAIPATAASAPVPAPAAIDSSPMRNTPATANSTLDIDRFLQQFGSGVSGPSTNGFMQTEALANQQKMQAALLAANPNQNQNQTAAAPVTAASNDQQQQQQQGNPNHNPDNPDDPLMQRAMAKLASRQFPAADEYQAIAKSFVEMKSKLNNSEKIARELAELKAKADQDNQKTNYYFATVITHFVRSLLGIPDEGAQKVHQQIYSDMNSGKTHNVAAVATPLLVEASKRLAGLVDHIKNLQPSNPSPLTATTGMIPSYPIAPNVNAAHALVNPQAAAAAGIAAVAPPPAAATALIPGHPYGAYTLPPPAAAIDPAYIESFRMFNQAFNQGIIQASPGIQAVTYQPPAPIPSSISPFIVNASAASAGVAKPVINSNITNPTSDRKLVHPHMMRQKDESVPKGTFLRHLPVELQHTYAPVVLGNNETSWGDKLDTKHYFSNDFTSRNTRRRLEPIQGVKDYTVLADDTDSHPAFQG
jgi:hypothetical protein